MKKMSIDKQIILEGKQVLTQNIKLILYKQNSSIFEELDFENDKIYQNPFVFAALNTKMQFNISNILWGFKSKELQEKSIEIETDIDGKFYLPNVGYFYTDKKTSQVNLSYKDNSYIIYDKFMLQVNFDFEPRLIIHDLFEVIKHPHFLLREHYYSAEGNLVDVEISEITQMHFDHLTLAFDIIRDYSSDFYDFLKECVHSVQIFKSESYDFLNSEVVDRNSFATLSVHGCAFFNAFQDEYNEVFFIEDIAHQCGHIIFNSFLASKPEIFSVDPNSNIASIEEVEEFEEERSLYVIMHAMYTYDSILRCLCNCIDNNVFDGHKLHELFGRLAFNCYKFKQDYQLLSRLDTNGNSLFFKDEGRMLLMQFLETHKTVTSKIGGQLQLLNLNNQPYNFSYRIFLENNPL
jgi:hypothetical protein